MPFLPPNQQHQSTEGNNHMSSSEIHEPELSHHIHTHTYRAVDLDDACLNENVSVLGRQDTLADQLLSHRDRLVVRHAQVRQVVQEPAATHTQQVFCFVPSHFSSVYCTYG